MEYNPLIANFSKDLKTLIQRNVFVLLFILILSSSALILINYYTIKTLSAARAYINGESSYAKGQKDALYNLVLFINTGDEKRWALFEKCIAIPFGDSIARVELTNNGEYHLIEKGFLQAGSHKEDIGNLIWLFKNFKNVSFMKDAIILWKEADYLNFKLYEKADSVRKVMQARTLSFNERNRIIESLDQLNKDLTIKQSGFSEVMGTAARDIRGYLFFANIFLIVLIIGCATAYCLALINRLTYHKWEVDNKNHELTKINKDLDTFVYTASHDLKAPIANLEGLINVLKKKMTDKINQEEDKLFVLMESSVIRFKSTIQGLTEVTKVNKTVNEDIELVFFNKVLEEIKEDLNQLIVESNVKISTDFQVKDIYFSRLNLRSIIYNLVSNAIKYHSPERNPVIDIKTEWEGEQCILSVKDNGLGFDMSRKDKIFSMFKRLHTHVEGTGIGLFIVKRIVEDAGGKIEVQSELDEGTVFKVYLPR